MYYEKFQTYKSRDNSIMTSPCTHNPARHLSTHAQFVCFIQIATSSFLIILKQVPEMVLFHL